MKLAIIIPTYRREDGRSPFYLKRSLESVFNQDHTDFKIFLVGDHYDNDEEWNTIISPYLGERFWAYNLAKPGERDKYKDNISALWSSGGVSAHNYATEIALKEGFDYICHLDHDDYWVSNHLKVISDVIEETKADWLCTRSTFRAEDNIIPTVENTDRIVPYIPKGCHLINSSTCYNYRTIPLRYRDVYEETGVITPSDADLWDRIGTYVVENKLSSYLINELTCFHNEEGDLRTCG